MSPEAFLNDLPEPFRLTRLGINQIDSSTRSALIGMINVLAATRDRSLHGKIDMLVKRGRLKCPRGKLKPGVELPLLVTRFNVQCHIAINAAQYVDLAIPNPGTAGAKKSIVVLCFPDDITCLKINCVGI